MKRTILLLAVSVFWAFAIVAQNTNTASGKCGGDVEWSFDGRTLYINSAASRKNSVEMPDYDLSKNVAPWVKQKLSVRKVVIGPGVSRIGSCAFANCEDLTTVEFQHTFLLKSGGALS